MLNSKFGQAVIVGNHTHQACEPKYLTGYGVIKIFNEGTLLLVTSSGEECKMSINDVKPCIILELVENAWNSFLNSIKTNCPRHEYNLRLCD